MEIGEKKSKYQLRQMNFVLEPVLYRGIARLSQWRSAVKSFLHFCLPDKCPNNFAT